jgi:hypothetical protein
MLVLLGTVLAMLAVPLLGGRLAALSDLRLHARPLVALALGLQVVALTLVPTWPRPLLVVLHGTSYVLAGLFVRANRHLPGLVLIALGGLSNALAIAVNHGTLPASRSAVARAGLQVDPRYYVNSGVLEHPHLLLLGDVFPSPPWLPLHNVYSIGDLLILAGAVWLVHRTCGTVLGRDPRLLLRRAHLLPAAR